MKFYANGEFVAEIDFKKIEESVKLRMELSEVHNFICNHINTKLPHRILDWRGRRILRKVLNYNYNRMIDA